MEINTKTTPGHYDEEKVEIEVKNNKFQMKISINNNGELKVEGATKIKLSIPIIFKDNDFIVSKTKSGDELRILIDKDGVEMGPEIMATLGKLRGCLVFSEEDGKPVIKARDGTGSWNRETATVFE
jgi:hypothetical protein